MIKNKKKKHIVFLCDQTVDFHFPAHFYKVYGEILRQRGYKTTIVANYSDPNHENVVQMKGLGVGLFPKNAGYNSILKRLVYTIGQVFRLAKFIASRDIRTADYYVVHNDPIIGFMIYIRNIILPKKPFIYRLTHLVPEEILLSESPTKRFLAKINKFMRNFLLKRADYILPTSPVACDIVIEQIPCVRNKTNALFATADMSPDFSDIDYRKYARKLKARMCETPCEKWMVYLGTLSNNRQLNLMIDALEIIRKDYNIKAGLIVFGIECQSGGVEDLRQYAKSKDCLEYILFEKPVTEELLPYVVSLADVGISCFPVNSVVKANSPLKTLDYVRSNIPVVGSPIDNHKETIVASGAGYVADNTPEDFAKAVIKLFNENDEQTAIRMKRAKAWMKDNRDLNVAADIIEAAIKRIDN